MRLVVFNYHLENKISCRIQLNIKMLILKLQHWSTKYSRTIEWLQINKYPSSEIDLSYSQGSSLKPISTLFSIPHLSHRSRNLSKSRTKSSIPPPYLCWLSFKELSRNMFYFLSKYHIITDVPHCDNCRFLERVVLLLRIRN